MECLHAFKVFAGNPYNDVSLKTDLLPERFEPAFGDNVNFTPFLNSRILKIRVKCNSQVCRQCPGGRGPNNYKHIFPFQIGKKLFLGFLIKSKLHEYGRRFLVAVFDFGLCKSGNTGRTPVHRLFPFIDRS